jgi:two-component system chemotaxis response regulator CheB
MCATVEDAYNKIKTGTYDLVLIDVATPAFRGIQLLQRLRREGNRISVIALSTDLREDRRLTNRALELGVDDLICKPVGMNLKDRNFRKSLLLALHGQVQHKQTSEERTSHRKNTAMGPEERGRMHQSLGKEQRQYMTAKDQVNGKGIAERREEAVMNKRERSPGESKPKRKHQLIALTCSTGGPQALHVVLPMLPADLRVPMVVVQHMPEGFTGPLAERLNQLSAVRVKEAEEGEVLEPGVVYIAPGGRHLEVADDQGKGDYIHLTMDPPINSLRPCADVMFHSLKNTSYSEIICVVLTGMGSDGTKGITELNKHKKIYCISESESSCVVYGMPKSIAGTGLANEVVPINEIADAIIKKVEE